MVDLRDFNEEQERQKEIQNVIKKLSSMTPEEHQAQDAKVFTAYAKLMLDISKLHLHKAEGEKLSLEENKMLVKLTKSLEDLQNYLTLSQAARGERLLESSNKFYYHIKNLAKQGDKKAEKIYLELKKSKEEQLKNELGDTDN